MALYTINLKHGIRERFIKIQKKHLQMHVIPTSWLNYLRRQIVFCLYVFSLCFGCSVFFTLCLCTFEPIKTFFDCIFVTFSFFAKFYTLLPFFTFYSLSLYLWTYQNFLWLNFCHLFFLCKKLHFNTFPPIFIFTKIGRAGPDFGGLATF